MPYQQHANLSFKMAGKINMQLLDTKGKPVGQPETLNAEGVSH